MTEFDLKNKRFTLSLTGKVIFMLMTIIGVITVVAGFLTHPERTWANLLVNNFLFLSLSVGAAFFLAIQYVSQSGWSSGFLRVPEAVSLYIPVAAILFLLMIPGLRQLFTWADTTIVAHDHLLLHKSPYLNVPFFIIRNILFFGLWILLVLYLRKLSLQEDRQGGLTWFEKKEFYSRVFIFVLAITFSFAIFDWIMSTEPHWFSTILAFKNFIASFYHGSILVILIILYLHDKGFFPFLNKSHLHDFSRYIFILAIIWGYLWFAQFMIIWYGNIPEETVYFKLRMESPWNILFYADILINWALPFLILMPRATSRSKTAIRWVGIFVLAGFWIDYYLQVVPGTTGAFSLGITELGTLIGFAGIFLFVIFTALGKAPVIPENHPYLEESLEHHF